jgi:hypothetical protein
MACSSSVMLRVTWTISLALAQALALQETIIPLLRRPGGVLPCHQLYPYQQAYRAIVRPYYRYTHLMLWLSRHQALAQHLISALHTHPALLQKLLSASMGAKESSYAPSSSNHLNLFDL